MSAHSPEKLTALAKDIRRTIRKERRRFVAIMIITMLGVMMFSGLKASCEDLRKSADRFFDEQNLHDIQIVSTLGLTDADIAELQEIDGVLTADGVYSEEVSAEVAGNTLTIDVGTIPASGIDAPFVTQGRMPSASGEAVVTDKFLKDTGAAIGDVFVITKNDAAESDGENESGNASAGKNGVSAGSGDTAGSGAADTATDEKDALDDISIDTGETDENVFRVSLFTIVGSVTDVRDIDNPFGSVSYRTSTTDSDKAFILPEDADNDVYTSVILTLDGTRELYCFSAEYENAVKSVKNQIEDKIKTSCENARTEEVKNEARKTLEDAKAEAEEKLDDALQKLNDGEQELADQEADGRQKLEDSRAEGEAELATRQAEGEQTLADAEAELQNQLAEARTKLESGQEELDASLSSARAELENGQAELDAQLAAAAQQLADAQNKIDAAKSELETQKTNIAFSRAQLESGQEKLDEAKAELSSQEESARASRAQIETAMAGLDEEIQTAGTSLSDAENEKSEAEAEAEALRQQIASLEDAAEGSGEERQTGGETAEGGGEDHPKENTDETSALKKQLAEKETRINALSQTITSLSAQIETLQGQYAELESQLSALQAAEDTLAAAEAELSGKQTEIDAGLAEIAAAEEQIQAAEQEIAAQQAQIDAGRAAYESGKAEGQAKIDAGWAEYEQGAASGQAEIDSGWAEYESGKAAGEKKIADGRAELAQGIADGRAQLEEGLAEGQTQLAQGIADGRAELDDGWDAYNDAKAEFDEKIADAEAEIDAIEAATWYVQDRYSLSGYSNVDSDASSIEAIGTVFPIVFFVVAVLISLTAITRMVDEDRGLIGTYKSLGYTDREIRRKYLIYAAAACAAGSVLGTVLAFLALPGFIFTIFDVMYLIPAYHFSFVPAYGILGPALFMGGILIATFVAAKNELREVPAALMRPKAPHAGSRVLLERITPIWKRLSFLNKVTARNLFRYKKRMFMTIFGIGGCMALLLFGFAIKDSVNDLMPRQYEETFHYDFLAVASSADNDALMDYVENSADVSSYINCLIDSAKLMRGEEEGTVTLITVPEGADFSKYMSLVRTDGAEMKLRDGDIYVTQNAGNVMGFSDGARLSLQLGDLQEADIKVTALVKNYLGNYVYMTENTWKTLYEDYAPNGVIGDLDSAVSGQTAWCDAFAGKDGVISCTSIEKMKEQFSGAFQLINAVVYVVIAMSAALAFVVLFTLQTTNISERTREIATIKVLGFFDREVHSYIDKETLILCVIGIVLGIPLGRAFAQTLTAILNLPSIYLAVSLHAVSYLVGAVLTFGFALAVNFIMDRVLNRIDPVEALKSVE